MVAFQFYQGTDMAYVSFENLEVWKRACRLAVEVFNLMKGCNEYVLNT